MVQAWRPRVPWGGPGFLVRAGLRYGGLPRRACLAEGPVAARLSSGVTVQAVRAERVRSGGFRQFRRGGRVVYNASLRCYPGPPINGPDAATDRVRRTEKS